MDCPIKNKFCPCPEYSKELLCDFPFKNSEAEIKCIKLFGHRYPQIKYPEKISGKN